MEDATPLSPIEGREGWGYFGTKICMGGMEKWETPLVQ